MQDFFSEFYLLVKDLRRYTCAIPLLLLNSLLYGPTRFPNSLPILCLGTSALIFLNGSFSSSTSFSNSIKLITNGYRWTFIVLNLIIISLNHNFLPLNLLFLDLFQRIPGSKYIRTWRWSIVNTFICFPPKVDLRHILTYQSSSKNIWDCTDISCKVEILRDVHRILINVVSIGR